MNHINLIKECATVLRGEEEQLQEATLDVVIDNIVRGTNDFVAKEYKSNVKVGDWTKGRTAPGRLYYVNELPIKVKGDKYLEGIEFTVKHSLDVNLTFAKAKEQTAILQVEVQLKGNTIGYDQWITNYDSDGKLAKFTKRN